MIYALLLLASLANAQEVSTGAATSLLDEVRISNLGKDTRDLLSGRYRQTGKPTFAGGICFADGTCQTTAGAGLTSTQTFSGANTFTGNVVGVVRISSFSTGAYASGTTTIPYDDTIPQVTEGDQYMSLVHTPRAAGNKLVVTVNGNYSASVAQSKITQALFVDGGANAVAAQMAMPVGNDYTTQNAFTYIMTAASVSAVTFTVRAGGSSAITFYFNGDGASAARKLGGVMASSIIVEEYGSN